MVNYTRHKLQGLLMLSQFIVYMLYLKKGFVRMIKREQKIVKWEKEK
jgi:hypothetical protein